MKVYADFKVAIEVPDNTPRFALPDLFEKAFKDLNIEITYATAENEPDILLLPNKVEI